MQLLGFISLKPDQDADSYETWVREVVHPAAMALPSITRYDVYKVDGPFRPGGAVPYQFIEVVTITSVNEVRRDFARPEIASLLAEFATRRTPCSWLEINSRSVGACRCHRWRDLELATGRSAGRTRCPVATS